MLMVHVEAGPAVVRAIQDEGDGPPPQVADLLRERRIREVLLLGCGTSRNASVALAAAFDAAGPCRVWEANAFEWTEYAGGRDLTRTLVVAISQSGESTATIAALGRAKSAGAITFAVTANPAGSLARAADVVLLTHCADEPPGPKTKGFLGALAVGQRLLTWLQARVAGDGVGAAATARPATWAPPVSLVERALRVNRAPARRAAEIVVDAAPLVVVGGGPALGVAMEAALKLQEIAKLHAVAYEVEEAMHGPVYAMDGRAVAIVIAQQGPSLAKVQRFVAGFEQVGASTILVGPAASTFAGARYALTTPEWDERTSMMLLAVPLQLLAVEAARFRGVPQGNPYPQLKWKTKTFHTAP